MAAYCTINPQIRSTATGELVDSKLFSELKKSVGYANARKVFVKVRSNEFIEEYDDDLSKDENGEYTLSSLKTIDELMPFLGAHARRMYASEQAGAYSPTFATEENIDFIESKAIEYNSNSGNEFIALPEIYEDNNGVEIIQLKLVENTVDNREKASQITRKRILVSRLSDAFERAGINPATINIMLESLRNEGMSDYDATIKIAEDIRALGTIANGGSAKVDLPNLMANLIYNTLSGSFVTQRIINAIDNGNLASSILSEDAFNEVSNSDVSLSEMSMIQLISDYILNGSDDEIGNVPELRNLDLLFERFSNMFNEVFSQINDSEIDSYINQAESSETNRKFQEEPEEEFVFNQEASETKEFKQAKRIVDKQKKLLHDIIENNVRRYKIISSRDTNYDKKNDQLLTSSLYQNYQDEEYELGIFDFIDATLDQLEAAEERLRELNEKNDLSAERKATILKNIKDYIRSYEVSVDAIKKAELAGYIKPSAERSAALYQATQLIGRLTAEYERQKYPLLVAFVKRFIGDGIEVPFGKEKGKTYTAEDILEMADKDISVFDRWLDSMAESGDLMLRMLDQTAKKARSEARLQTIEYKKKIDAIYLRLKRSGITDTSFMFERDPNGHKTGKYISYEDAKLLDPARRNYYEDFMKLKGELDAKLPKGSTYLQNIIRVRKDYIERLKGQDSINGVIKETKEALKDKVKRRSDNAEAGENGERTKNTLIDFSGRQVEVLPIMFVNSKDGENIDDISEDTTSSLLMYANMATNFSAMNNVVGLLELVREHVQERPVRQRAGGKPLISVLKAFGLPVTTELTKSGDATNLVQRMNDWFSSQVYSRYMKDEGEILGMDVGMLANLSNEVTALNQFALNILSGISNVMTASAMNRIESICGQYFSVKNLAEADKIFWAALPEFLGDVGSPVKTSKLALFLEKFNVMQDFESDVRGQDYRKSRLGHLLNTNSLYVINNAGELWIQSRAALALGNSYGLVDANGDPISLWDSQEVVLDKDGVGRLVTKKGVRKADGTVFDEKDDVRKFTNKAKSLNQRMNGIYNYEDRNAAQAYAWGRMALMFRKWIKPSLNRRYASVNYNFDVEEWEEGFYRTTGRFFLQLIKDLKRGQLDIVTSYKNLDPRERANLMRFAVEVGQFVSVCAAFAILKDIKKNADDDDEALAKSWWFNQLLYQTRRLETEIGSQMIINPQMTQEALNILKSPAACVSTWEGVSNLTQLLVPSNYTKTIQTGRYKGHTKAYKLFWDSPIIPMHRTVYRGLHPQNSLQFYDI